MLWDVVVAVGMPLDWDARRLYFYLTPRSVCIGALGRIQSHQCVTRGVRRPCTVYMRPAEINRSLGTLWISLITVLWSIAPECNRNQGCYKEDTTYCEHALILSYALNLFFAQEKNWSYVTFAVVSLDSEVVYIYFFSI